MLNSLMLRKSQSLTKAFLVAAAIAVWKAFEDDRAKWSRPWALVVLADWSERNL